MAQALLLAGLLGALGFFDLEQTRQFEPVILLGFVALFAWLALSVSFGSAWTLRVFLPAVGLLLFVLLYAYVFTLRVDSPLLPSILAQRDYAYFLLGPVVYMLHLRGWELRDFQQVFLAAASLTVIGLAVYDVAFASNSLLLSGTFFALNLGELTEQSRIFRFVNTSALFLALYLGRRLFQVRDVFVLGSMLGAAVLSAALLAVSIPRGLLVSTGAAVAVYAALLSRPRRAGLSVIVLPLCVLAFAVLSPSLGSAFVGQFGQDRTYQVRAESAETAWRVFRDYPLLGFGQEGVQTASFQDFFGENFYPSDIGLLGVAFQFGLVGMILYLSLAGWLCVSLLKMVWASKAGKTDPKQGAFLWALLVVCLGFLIASPLQARLVYGTGLPVGAFAWGLVMIHRHGTPAAAPPAEGARQPGPARALGPRG